MVVVVVGADWALRCGDMANAKTLEQARRAARERLAQAQRERAEREAKSVDDAAELIRARTRVGEVDAWEAERIAAVAVEADRKRAEHEAVAVDSVVRMRARGESIKTIALLADLAESEVRRYVRARRPAAGVELGEGEVGADAEASAVSTHSEARPLRAEATPPGAYPGAQASVAGA